LFLKNVKNVYGQQLGTQKGLQPVVLSFSAFGKPHDP